MNVLRISLILIASMFVITMLPREPSALGAADPDRVEVLEKRIATLERVIRDLDRSPEFSSLQSRITKLERAQREIRNATSGVATRSQSSGQAQVMRDHTSLKSAVTRLESRVASTGQFTTQLQRDVSSLRQKVANLQSAVDRLR